MTRGKCGASKNRCFDDIKEQLIIKPKGKGDKTLEYNWEDLNSTSVKTTNRLKIEKFNVGQKLAAEFSTTIVEFPEEFRELENTANEIEQQINDIEKQAEELKRQAEEELNRRYGNNRGYRWLKKKYEHLSEAIDKAEKAIGEKIGELAEDLPEVSLDQCTD